MNIEEKFKKICWIPIRAIERCISSKDTVYVAGWIGSGSTFIYQTLKDLGISVNKIHGFPKHNNGAFVIYTIRDPRDIAVSTARRHFKVVGKSEGNEAAMFKAIDHLKEHNMGKDFECCLSASNRMIVRYESFFGGREVQLMRTIVDQIRPNANLAEVSDAVSRNSLDANRQRMKQLGSFDEYDKKNLLHGNHISTGGKSGVWQDEFTDAVMSYFDSKLGSVLEISGYASE